MTPTDLLARLVAIDAGYPALSPGAPGERAISNSVAGWLVGGRGHE